MGLVQPPPGWVAAVTGQQKLVLYVFVLGCVLACLLGAMYAPLPQ